MISETFGGLLNFVAAGCWFAARGKEVLLCTHTRSDHTKLNFHSLKRADGQRQRHGTENTAGLQFGEKTCV